MDDEERRTSKDGKNRDEDNTNETMEQKERSKEAVSACRTV